MKTRFVLSIIAAAIAFVIIGVAISKSISLDQNCTGYLKRAADSNTVELALRELSKSIKYLEDNNLTKGYTSIFIRTPDEDIEFWYNNLKECQDELLKVDSLTSQLEKTNILMKLRETLTDDSKNGTQLTYPSGLSLYPNNGFFAFLLMLAAFSLVWFFVEIIIYDVF